MKRSRDMYKPVRDNGAYYGDCWYCGTEMIDPEKPVELDVEGEITVQCPACGATHQYALQRRWSLKVPRIDDAPAP